MGFFSRSKKGKKGKKEESKAAAAAAAATSKNGLGGQTAGSSDAIPGKASPPQQQQQQGPAAPPDVQHYQPQPPQAPLPAQPTLRKPAVATQEQFASAATMTPTPPPPPPMTSVTDMPVGDPAFAKADVTRDLVKKFISDIWNRGELDLIPQVCSPKIRFNGNSGLDKIGHDGFAMMVATIHGALSDYHCEIHSMVVEDNKAFCRLRFSGKHTGDLLGYPPTGRVVSWMGATEFTAMNGRILKVWELGDMKTLEQQLQD